MDNHESWVATHEASHAVAAIALGLPLHRVSVVRADDSSGRTSMLSEDQLRPAAPAPGESPDDRPLNDDVILRTIAMVAAGRLGAAMLGGFDEELGAGSDIQTEIALAFMMSDREFLREPRRRAIARARGLVSRHRGAILAVALELVQHGTITGDCVREIIAKHQRPDPAEGDAA